MTSQVIPEAAVEAAARLMHDEEGYFELFEDAPDFRKEHFRGKAKAILEAAAPHMATQQAVAAVLALHREMECRDEDNEPIGGSYCEECKDLDDHSGERVHEVYPCLTVREITKALAGEEAFTAMRDRIENPYRSQS